MVSETTALLTAATVHRRVGHHQAGPQRPAGHRQYPSAGDAKETVAGTPPAAGTVGPVPGH